MVFFSYFLQFLGKLKSINLSSSVNLISTPDFSGVPRLELLNLAYCTNLVGLHPSIGQLSKLKILNLYFCTSLTNLPSLSAKMESLILGQTAIKKLPPIECLTALEILYLSNCSDLKCLPSNMDSLRSLKFLNLSGCSKLANLLENLWKIKCLERLDLSGISQLEEIELNAIGGLSSLEYLSLMSNNFVTLPATFSQLSKLEALDLSYCQKLRSVPELPSTTRYIRMEGCYSLEPIPELLGLNDLLRPCFFPLLCGYDESGGGVALTILSRYLQVISSLSLTLSLHLLNGISCVFFFFFFWVQGLFCQKTGYETATKRKEDGSKTEFQIIIPGYHVPRWLMHQSRGNSISVVLSPNWCNSWWMGFTLCAHFNTNSFRSGFRARVKAIGDMPHSQYVSECFFRRCSSYHHIWLLYLSRDDWFSTVGNGECSQIEVVFEESSDFGSSVLQCGVSLVYMQDMEVWYSRKTWNGSKCTM